APERASRPFDRDRDGFVMGEGAGVVVLEDRDRALARGARIYAEVAGYDTTGEPMARAMHRALRQAGLPPTALDYLNAHGTSTSLNDRFETQAIKLALGKHAYQLPINSTKSL